MNVIGLDVSLNSTGIALLEDGKFKIAGTIKPGVAVGAARLVRMWDQIDEWWTANGIDVDLFAIEGYSYASRTSQAHSTGELGGVIRYELQRRGEPYIVIPPATWRKEVLGRGNLAKSEVRIEVFKRYGLELVSEDALEAFCVAYAGWLQATGASKPKITRKRKAA